MQHLLLLHGAVGAKDQFSALAENLKDKYTVHTFNFSGHGDADMPAAFSIAGFADDVLQYLEVNKLASVSVFGYSMGGYVALYLAAKYADRIAKVFTLATKFEWTPEIAAREIKMLDAEKITQKIPAFAQQLQQRHSANDWKRVLTKTAAMMVLLGNENPLQADDFRGIQQPVMVAIGDKDQMVTLEETIAVYRQLSNANLLVLPDTQHPIEKVAVVRLVTEIERFFG